MIFAISFGGSSAAEMTIQALSYMYKNVFFIDWVTTLFDCSLYKTFFTLSAFIDCIDDVLPHTAVHRFHQSTPAVDLAAHLCGFGQKWPITHTQIQTNKYWLNTNLQICLEVLRSIEDEKTLKLISVVSQTKWTNGDICLSTFAKRSAF